MLAIRKGDTVKVITGRDRGKTGRVLRILGSNRLEVEHVNIVKRHMRANPNRNIKAGILSKEGPIHVSNVMLVCPACGPIRPKMQVLPEGRKVRACRKCGNTLGQ